MNIIKLDEIDSTNLYAKKNIASLADKSVIIAQKQTSGRGRFDRSWIDLGEGNIFMSIVLKPSDSFSPVFVNLTQYMSVILAETIEEYGLKPSIKWPNDVLIDGKKIAGILSETVMQGTLFKGIILGAGINLNSNENDLSAIKDKEATALNIELSCKPVNKNEFLEKLLNKFYSKYDDFLNKGFEMIKKDYLKRASFLNKEISVQVFNETKSGLVKSVNDSGELVIEKDDKELILTMGDIL